MRWSHHNWIENIQIVSLMGILYAKRKINQG